MGAYWKWVCPERGEHLDPRHLAESDKHPVEDVRCLRVLAWLCQYGAWSGMQVKLISDAEGEYYWGEHLAPEAGRLDGPWWRDPPDLADAIERTRRAPT